MNQQYLFKGQLTAGLGSMACIAKLLPMCYNKVFGEQKKIRDAMQTLSIREMRNQLGRLDKILARDREIIVTRHNTPLARILPIKGKKTRPDHKSLRDSLPYQNIDSEVLQRIDRDER